MAGIMAGSKGSLKIGRLKVATSRVVRVIFGKEGEVVKMRWTKSTTAGPTRTGRVLPMMIATFFGIGEAITEER